MANSVIKANIGAVLNSYEGDIVTIKSPIERPFIMNMQADINPVQDLHGYDKPWAGGNGKNLLTMTIKSLKAENISGTWSGNTYSYNGGTFDIQTDSDGNVTGILVNCDGTNSGVPTLYIKNANLNGSFIINGCPSGGSWSPSTNKWRLRVAKYNNAYITQSFGGDTSFTTDSGVSIQINVGEQYAVSNLLFKPMIRLASETDDSFAPYSNICPISGWSECNLSRTGINVYDEVWELGIINATTGANNSNTTRIRTANYTSVKPNQKYYCKSPQSCYAYFYKADKSYTGIYENVANSEFTVPYNAYYVRFSLVQAYGTTYNNDVSINYPSTDTAYHAYNGNTFIIDLDGTRYGGTIDVTSGVLSVTHELRTGLTASNTGTSGSGVKYADIGITGLVQNASVISSQYIQINTSATGIEGAFKAYSGALTVYDNRFTSKSVADTALADVEWLLPLATPLTVSLTPTQIEALLGTNNIWCSTGQTKLTALEMESIS